MSYRIEFDSTKSGLRAVLFDWQLDAIKVVWDNPNGVNSRFVWKAVNDKRKPESISRASIINFLEKLRETNILEGYEKTGKGGYHGVYSPGMDEKKFTAYIITKMVEHFKKNFPKETEQALKKLT